jgi:hypothetical protein
MLKIQFPIKRIVIRIVIHIKYRDTYRLWKKCIVTPLVLEQTHTCGGFNVYKNQLSRQTGSRNLTGPKTLPTI